jgi:hypothetical protein
MYAIAAAAENIRAGEANMWKMPARNSPVPAAPISNGGFRPMRSITAGTIAVNCRLLRPIATAGVSAETFLKPARSKLSFS